jgi:hypothetical protein
VTAPDGKRRVRLTTDPNNFVYLTEVEYFQKVQEGVVVRPSDPDRPVPKWPDLSETYVQAPDAGLNRFQFDPHNQER